MKMIKLIYKKFVRSGSSGLKCLSQEVRDNVQSKIESGEGMDANIFDGAQQEVVEEMERFKFKFFESDYYINYIRSLQVRKIEIRLSARSKTYTFDVFFFLEQRRILRCQQFQALFRNSQFS